MRISLPIQACSGASVFFFLKARFSAPLQLQGESYHTHNPQLPQRSLYDTLFLLGVSPFIVSPFMMLFPPSRVRPMFLWPTERRLTSFSIFFFHSPTANPGGSGSYLLPLSIGRTLVSNWKFPQYPPLLIGFFYFFFFFSLGLVWCCLVFFFFFFFFGGLHGNSIFLFSDLNRLPALQEVKFFCCEHLPFPRCLILLRPEIPLLPLFFSTLFKYELIENAFPSSFYVP